MASMVDRVIRAVKLDKDFYSEAERDTSLDQEALLVVVFVVDVNVARYLVGSDVGVFPGLKEKCEEEFLAHERGIAEEKTRAIAEAADKRGVKAQRHVVIGRFGVECVKIAEREKPALIVTTRSKRPGWVRRFFGSPVDYLIDNAGCSVIEA